MEGREDRKLERRWEAVARVLRRCGACSYPMSHGVQRLQYDLDLCAVHVPLVNDSWWGAPGREWLFIGPDHARKLLFALTIRSSQSKTQWR
jgi:hypothetical protein